jgi:hypothetical protein
MFKMMYQDWMDLGTYDYNLVTNEIYYHLVGGF